MQNCLIYARQLQQWSRSKLLLPKTTKYQNSGKLQRSFIQAAKILGTRNLPRLVCIFSTNGCGLQQRQLQLSCINRIVLLFSFLYRHHLAVCLSPTNNISLSHTEFREIFFHFYNHSTLLLISNRTTSYLASSSRRNFGTRSLNNQNSEVVSGRQRGLEHVGWRRVTLYRRESNIYHRPKPDEPTTYQWHLVWVSAVYKVTSAFSCWRVFTVYSSVRKFA